jgi:hypothetical protein
MPLMMLLMPAGVPREVLQQRVLVLLVLDQLCGRSRAVRHLVRKRQRRAHLVLLDHARGECDFRRYEVRTWRPAKDLTENVRVNGQVLGKPLQLLIRDRAAPGFLDRAFVIVGHLRDSRLHAIRG